MSDPSGTGEPAEAEPTPTAAEAAAQAQADREDRNRGRIELLCAVMLGLAGALTAFSAYKAALTDGDALKGYTESTKNINEANFFYSQGNQVVTNDQALFLQYQIALNTDEAFADDVIRGAFFSDLLEEATAEWEVMDPETRPPTPIDLESYVPEDYDSASQLEEQSKTDFDAAFVQDEAGDKFELAAVFLAVSLFFAGVASLFRRPTIRYAALVGSVLFVIPGILSMLDGNSSL